MIRGKREKRILPFYGIFQGFAHSEVHVSSVLSKILVFN